MRRLVQLWLALIVALLLIAGAVAVGRDVGDSVLARPGPARRIGPMLTIAGQPRPMRTGGFYLTSVSIDANVSLPEWTVARLGLGGELQPRARIRPHGISPEAYGEISRNLLDESAEVAKVVALRRAGYPVEVRNTGAVITAVLPGRPADGPLKARDRVTAVDGQPVATAAELSAAIRRRAVGEPVRLTISRDGAVSEVTLPTAASTVAGDQPAIGVTTSTDATVEGMPFEITLDAERLGGPSAGLMFTLTILDALGQDDLARGQKVAGTGTIALDETVGPIDGVAHKVKGAERVGARYFLAPRANAAEARAAAGALTVVEVNTLQEALDFLKTLPAADAAPTPLPAAAPALAPAA
jgi:PDZ domain-containing protein